MITIGSHHVGICWNYWNYLPPTFASRIIPFLVGKSAKNVICDSYWVGGRPKEYVWFTFSDQQPSVANRRFCGSPVPPHVEVQIFFCHVGNSQKRTRGVGCGLCWRCFRVRYP